MRKTTSYIAVASMMGLMACGDAAGTFYNEAGSSVDEGGFGNPTMTNSLISQGKLQVAETLARRFASEVPPTINFAFNSAALDGQARSILSRQAAWIKQFPEIRFRVYGHTDLVGSDSYNRSLGQRRANAAVNYLVGQGISRSRLEAVVSFGETRPLIVTSGPERQNRRTVTEVSGFVTGHPNVIQGKYAALVYRQYTQIGTRAERTNTYADFGTQIGGTE